MPDTSAATMKSRRLLRRVLNRRVKGFVLPASPEKLKRQNEGLTIERFVPG
jgi:hypothetical protein